MNNVSATNLTANLTILQLVEAFELTDKRNDEEMPVVRGFLMDELERRDAMAFEAWIESYESPRKFFIK